MRAGQIVWAKLNNASVLQGEEQEHWNNTRMGSMPFRTTVAGQVLVLLNVLHADGEDNTDPFIPRQQDTGFLVDLRIADIETENLTLRPLAIQGFYDMQHRRTQCHVSHCAAVRNSAERADVSTHHWDNAVKGRFYTPTQNQDTTKPRVNSIDGIDSFAIEDGTLARSEHAQLGDLMHIGDGLLHDYDGCRVVENGFLAHPRVTFTGTDNASATGVDDGTYSWTATYEHRIGDRVYRSAPSVPFTQTLSGGSNRVFMTVDTLCLTMRSSIDNDYNTKPVIVIYRTLAGAPDVYHRVGEIFPDDGSGIGAREMDPSADAHLQSFTDESRRRNN